MTAGDNITVTFNNCDGLDGLSGFINGRVSIRVLAYSENSISGGYTARLSLTFGNVLLDDGMDVYTVDGDLTTDEVLRLPPEAREIVVGFSTNRLDSTISGDRYVLEDYGFDYRENDTRSQLIVDGAIQSPDFTGIAFVETVQPLTINFSDSSGSGLIRIYGKDNRMIRLTYLGNQRVRVEVDLDGVLDDTGQRDFEIAEEGAIWDYVEAI